jgi:hypothetical protein
MCKCGHGKDEHLDEDDLSACLGDMVIVTSVLPNRFDSEPCPCSGYQPDHMAVGECLIQ